MPIFSLNPLECFIFDADSPLQGNGVDDLPPPQQTPSKSPENCVLSKSETIDILQREVARLFGGCEVQEIPMNISLEEYKRQKNQAVFCCSLLASSSKITRSLIPFFEEIRRKCDYIVQFFDNFSRIVYIFES